MGLNWEGAFEYMCGYACIGCGNCGKPRTLTSSLLCVECGIENIWGATECRACGYPFAPGPRKKRGAANTAVAGARTATGAGAAHAAGAGAAHAAGAGASSGTVRTATGAGLATGAPAENKNVTTRG